MNGNGELKKLDGTVYSGGFKYGKYHGSGKETLSDGKSYNGEWKSGERNG